MTTQSIVPAQGLYVTQSNYEAKKTGVEINTSKAVDVPPEDSYEGNPGLNEDGDMRLVDGFFTGLGIGAGLSTCACCVLA